jgi:stage III sporulation protein SpoIIIAA
VDTSNEIGGDGDIPHAAIGGARRMQVPEPSMQHRVMIEAVENHMPEVVIVDEIGTEAEAQACRSIAERGVMLIGTAHGERLANIIKNPTLSDLVCHHKNIFAQLYLPLQKHGKSGKLELA